MDGSSGDLADARGVKGVTDARKSLLSQRMVDGSTEIAGFRSRVTLRWHMLGGMPDVTRLLDSAAAGDRKAAAELLPLVYDELRNLAAARMASERLGHTLQPTALVHEAYLRLVGGTTGDPG